MERENEQTIDLNNFILQNRIGQGSFGKVYKAKSKQTGEIFAVKVCKEEINSNFNDNLMNLSREVNIIAKLNHPSILGFKGFSPFDFKKRPKPVLITEYASYGTLEDFILLEKNKKSESHYDDTRKLIILYGIASAMSYMHKHNIIHRDLKPSNILLDDFLLPKVSDFGLSKLNHSNLNSMTVKTVTGSVKGTPKYMSPEIWEKSEYSQYSDVYAFSLIAFEIITNRLTVFIFGK